MARCRLSAPPPCQGPWHIKLVAAAQQPHVLQHARLKNRSDRASCRRHAATMGAAWLRDWYMAGWRLTAVACLLHALALALAQRWGHGAAAPSSPDSSQSASTRTFERTRLRCVRRASMSLVLACCVRRYLRRSVF